MRKSLVTGLVIAILVGGFTGYFGHAFIAAPPVTSGDCGTWAGAIATFLAACVALWLATREDRRRRAQQRVAAINAAVSIKWSVNVLHHVVKSLTSDFRKFDQLESPADDYFFRAAEEIDKQPIWDLSSTEKLIYLEGRLANSLGAAFDIIKAQSYMLKHARTNEKDAPLKKKRDRAAKFLPRLERAQELLEDAITELKKYSLSADSDIRPFL